MNQMIPTGCFALALGVVGCVEAPDASTTDDDTASVDQDSTIFHQCAVGATILNADMVATPTSSDSCTRPSATINRSGANQCDCFDWQIDKNQFGAAHADANHPTCRPLTMVDVSVDFGHAYNLTANVDAWDTSADNGVECNNSTLAVTFQEFDPTTSQFVTMASPFGAQVVHPHWLGDHCSSAGAAIQVLGRGNDFRIRATATRGLGTPGFEHGFEGIRFGAWLNDVISG